MTAPDQLAETLNETLANRAPSTQDMIQIPLHHLVESTRRQRHGRGVTGRLCGALRGQHDTYVPGFIIRPSRRRRGRGVTGGLGGVGTVQKSTRRHAQLRFRKLLNLKGNLAAEKYHVVVGLTTRWFALFFNKLSNHGVVGARPSGGPRTVCWEPPYRVDLDRSVGFGGQIEGLGSMAR
jgi:hypothetical protein